MSTVYEIIKRFGNEGRIEFKPKSGRKCSISTPKLTQKFKRLLVNTNLSERLVVNKAGTDRATVQRIKAKCCINTRNCQTVPKYNEGQQKRAKTL